MNIFFYSEISKLLECVWFSYSCLIILCQMIDMIILYHHVEESSCSDDKLIIKTICLI